MDHRNERELIVTVGAKLYDRGLVGAAEGNLSVRLGDGLLLVTPAGLCKGWLEFRELAVVNLEGQVIGGGRVSSEIAMHLAVYRRRSDVNAVVHAHPITATGFALAGKAPDVNVSPEALCVLGPIGLAPFAKPGSAEVAESLSPLIGDHDVLLLANHGAVTVGADLWEAFYRMETLERFLQSLQIADRLGGAAPIPRELAEELGPKRRISPEV